MLKFKVTTFGASEAFILNKNIGASSAPFQAAKRDRG